MCRVFKAEEQDNLEQNFGSACLPNGVGAHALRHKCIYKYCVVYKLTYICYQ